MHETDSESESIWIDKIGFKDRVARLGDEDNFWSMGDTGPCGRALKYFTTMEKSMKEKNQVMEIPGTDM